MKKGGGGGRKMTTTTTTKRARTQLVSHAAVIEALRDDTNNGCVGD